MLNRERYKKHFESFQVKDTHAIRIVQCTYDTQKTFLSIFRWVQNWFIWIHTAMHAHHDYTVPIYATAIAIHYSIFNYNANDEAKSFVSILLLFFIQKVFYSIFALAAVKSWRSLCSWIKNNVQMKRHAGHFNPYSFSYSVCFTGSSCYLRWIVFGEFVNEN